MAKVVKKIIFVHINTQSYAEVQLHSECLSQARKGPVLLHNLVTSLFHHILWVHHVPVQPERTVK